VLWAAASVGCAGHAIDLVDLPDKPLVILHRDLETARRRAEILKDQKPDPASARGPGVARMSDVQKLLGKDVKAEFAELSGRVSYFDPRTETTTVIDSAPRGSEPLGWSADRKLLIFRTWRDEVPLVQGLDVAHGSVQQVTPYGVNAVYAAMAPDGRVVYSLFQPIPGLGPALRLMLAVPGSPPRPLTPGPVDRAPMFSPDGNLLIYGTMGRDGGEAIARLDPFEDDPAPRILARGRDAVFTPDGAWIVYSATAGKGHRLWRMRPDGSGKLPIGEGASDDPQETHPAVSPDGKFVAYVEERDSRFYLRVRRFDGTGDRTLLDDGDGQAPVW
jgi:hypothetical protein